jgi:hypothetical protein
MSSQVIIAIVSFVVLFALWVVVPSIVKKHHTAVEIEAEE